MSDESLSIRLTMAGQFVPIDEMNDEGVVLFGETSAWPRATQLVVDLIPEQRFKLGAVRQKMDWTPGEFRLNVERDGDGALLCTGIGPDAFPFGVWEVRMNIYGLRSTGTYLVEIPRGGRGVVNLPVRHESGSIQVSSDSDWPRRFREILSSSFLDTPLRQPWTGVSWVQASEPRARRRACLLNIFAVCQSMEISDFMEEVFLVEVDRVYAKVDAGLDGALRGDSRFHNEGTPTHPIHRKLLEGIPKEGGVSYTLTSFRQRRSPSLQIVTANPSDPSFAHYAEFDIDRGYARDPLGFIVHTAEVIHPGRTNHVKLWRKLHSTSAGEFLVYTA